MPQPLTVLRTGTGWTLDVTALALSSDLIAKDILVYHNAVLQPNTTYAKTSQTLLTYSGVALATNTSVQVWRDSTFVPTAVGFNEINSSAGINARLTQISRILEDLRFGIGGR